MKRSWIGAGLLALLLAAAGAVTWGMDVIHSPIAQALYRAAAAEDGQQARTAILQAEGAWEKWNHFRSCFADQTPVEQIDVQFAKLDHCKAEEIPALAAETARMVTAMGDSHDLTWWNFF